PHTRRLTAARGLSVTAGELKQNLCRKRPVDADPRPAARARPVERATIKGTQVQKSPGPRTTHRPGEWGLSSHRRRAARYELRGEYVRPTRRRRNNAEAAGLFHPTCYTWL